MACHGWALRALQTAAKLEFSLPHQAGEFEPQHLSCDVSAPESRFVLVLMASVAEFERGLISKRTKEGLAIAKQRGVKLGNPQQSFGIQRTV